MGIRAIPLIMIGASAVLAQDPGEAESDPLDKYKPMHRLTFPGNPYIGSAAFSADGETIFVHLTDQAINIWEILVYYGPELLGALTALTTLVCLFALWRIIRRKRLVGEPHCRKCNYCLHGCESERCPECGWVIRRPVIGRPMWRRIFPWTAPLALVVVVYGALWALRLPRSSWVNNCVNWWSHDLLLWADEKNIAPLTQWSRSVDRIVEVDVATGKTLRTLITRPAYMPPLMFPLRVTPDGSGLLITLREADRLALVSTRSGRVVRALSSAAAPPPGLSRWRQVAGFDEAGQTAHVVLLDEATRKTKLMAWNLPSGNSTILFESDAEVHAGQHKRPMIMARRYYRIPGSAPSRFLEMPNGYGVGSEPATFRVVVPTAADPVATELATTFEGHSQPYFSADGRRVHLHTRDRPSLAEFDLFTGDVLSTVQPPAWHNHYFIGCSDERNHRYILEGIHHSLARPWPTHTRVFLLRDTASSRWIGRYVMPDNWICLQLCASPDGRWFAAHGFRGGNKISGQYEQELLIYDLRLLPHDELDLSEDRQRP